MDTNLNDVEPPKTKESAMNNAENASFILEPGTLVTPQKCAAEATPNLGAPDVFKTPLNFSTVTVEQLGITPESFVKNSSGKSSYLKKSRRRSTVGARGSPETNHLIRFIAQQRNIKNARSPLARSPLAQDFPFQGSPGLYHNVNSLRERISAFQSAFHSIKENKKMADCPAFSEAGGGSEAMGLTKVESLGECQQFEFPEKLSSKRRRISSPHNSDDSLSGTGRRVTGLQILGPGADRTRAAEAPAGLPEKSSELGVTRFGPAVHGSPPVTEASTGLEVADCVEGSGSSAAVLLDPLTEAGTGPDARSPSAPVRRRDLPSTETFVLRSVLKKPVKLFPESLQEHHNNLCDDETQPSLISNLPNCCTEQKAEDQENCKAPTFLNMRKRKKVTFGEDLSPEVFDESLPANTPLRKGGTPVRQKDLSSVSPLPLEEAPVPEQLPQPNFDDKGENLENIEPLQGSFAVVSPDKSSVPEALSGTDTFSSSNNHEKITSHKRRRLTRTSNRRTQLIGFAEENVSNLYNTDAQPCKEKKINRRKSQETKCTNKALPKKNQVLKSCRKKKGRGKKSVEKSLYGERDIASKKPLLSPIPELPEVSEPTPSPPGLRRAYPDDCNSNCKLEAKPHKIPVKRNCLFPNPEEVHVPRGPDQSAVYGLCHSPVHTCPLPGGATSDEEVNTNPTDTEASRNIPKAEDRPESEIEPKTEARTENSRMSCAPMTTGHIVSHNPEPDFILQGQEFSAAGQNAAERYKILEDIKCEKKDGFLVATEGELQYNHPMSDSQNGFNCLEDVQMEKVKESKSHSDDSGRKPAENSSVTSCVARKHKRRSMCYSDSWNLHLEENSNHKPSYSVGSSVEISFEHTELCKDLSDAIEQTFQRADRETKVRRSTRLQKDSENEGLVWLSLPLASAAQRPRRRTVSTLDSRGLASAFPRGETVPSRQNLGARASAPAEEGSQGPAAKGSCLPVKRRKSLCASTLESTQNTTQPTRFPRRASLKIESPELTSKGLAAAESTGNS